MLFLCQIQMLIPFCIKGGTNLDGSSLGASYQQDGSKDSFDNFFREVDLTKIEMASARWVTFEIDVLSKSMHLHFWN